MKSQIQSVEVTYLVHATEDPAKIEGATRELLGVEVDAELQRLEGHFGNEITMVRFHVTGADGDSAVSRVFSRMSGRLRKEVASGVGSFVDEHSALFLRFDKQSLVQGSLVLGSGDAVRVKVKPRLFGMNGRAGDFYARLLEEGHGD